MAELKTQPTRKSPAKFIASVRDPQKKADSLTLLRMMKKVSRKKPVMWGSSIVGFGNYHYVGRSGREGDWFLIGFSPRKQYLSVYVIRGLKRQTAALKKLGKFSRGGGCLNIKRLGDVNLRVLEQILRRGMK